MGKNKFRLIFMALMVFTNIIIAQDNRYVVFFTDKNDSPYSIENSSEFLSDRSIERRKNQSIDITLEDFPVNASYVNQVKGLGAKTYFTSRWMNAVLVEASAEEIEAIEAEEFVLKTEYAAPGSKLSTSPEGKNIERAYPPPINASSLNSNIQLSMLSANQMHDEDINGSGKWIAVFDDGFLDGNNSIVFEHTLKNDKLKDEFDFISGGQNVFQYDDHGTSSWSCLGAYYDPYFIGTGFNADISLYVTEDVFSEYRIEEYNWLFAAERADSAGVDIITSSLGYYDFDDASMNYTKEDLDGKTSVISQAAEHAIKRGMLVVTSAGNEGNTAWESITMPADVENIISVGAIDSEYNLVSFSSVGPTADNRIKPEVTALGYQVTVLSENNELLKKNGTSFAAPLIAGFAAGLWQKYPSLTNLELRDLILSSSSNFKTPDNKMGYGIPNYREAIGEEPLEVTDLDKQGIKIYPNPVSGDHMNVLIEKDLIKSPVVLTLLSQSGQTINQKEIHKGRKGMVVEMTFNQNGQGIYFLRIESESFSKNVKIIRY